MVKPKRSLTYLSVLPLSLFLSAVAWLIIAPERLYHCWDDAPPLVISWFPPFVHPWANSADGLLRDYYIWPEWVVYATWFVIVAVAFLLPAMIPRKNHQVGTPKHNPR